MHFDVVCNLMTAYGARLECQSKTVFDCWNKVTANANSLDVCSEYLDTVDYKLPKDYQQDLFWNDHGLNLLVKNAPADATDENKFIQPLKCRDWVEKGFKLSLFSDQFDDSEKVVNVSDPALVVINYVPKDGADF